jgi:hypothetical protein
MDKIKGLAGSLNRRVWVTGDDCVSCGYGHVFFFEESADGGDHFGDLVCGACGAIQASHCFEYQVPEADAVQAADGPAVDPDSGPLFGGAK